jgi:hypothetical protein
MESDNEQLKLLEILHYVWMVLAAMSLVAGVIEVFFGIFVFGAAAKEIVIGLGIYTILGCGLAIPSSILTIAFYRRRRHYIFCIAASVFTCVSVFPLGVPLGIFTLVTLSQDSVRSVFR